MPQKKIMASMPGKVIRIEVEIGDNVREGQYVCVIESMKMENPISVEAPGTVNSIDVDLDQFVQTGDILAVIEY